MKKEAYISLNSPQYWAFNTLDMDCTRQIIDGAASAGRDVIIQTSVKPYTQFDKKKLRKFVTEYSREKGIRAFLHLDHCRDIEVISEAIEYGWDSVMYDGSALSLEENIRNSKTVCKLAHLKGVLVEAEVGSIVGVEDDVIVRESGVAGLGDVQEFVSSVPIDLIAIAVGTAHGRYEGQPNIHFELIEKAGKILSIPMVIHGGSGLTDDVIRKLLSYSFIKKINISTEIKEAIKKKNVSRVVTTKMNMNNDFN